jgi:hypothetical protein
MKLIGAIAVVAVVSVSVLWGAPALADPPIGKNPNAGVFIFHCIRGAETQTFEAISIEQNAAIAGQLLDGTGVIMFTHVEVNGQVVYDRPGLAGQSDLWTCTQEGATYVAQMLVTPRAVS